MLSQVQGLLSQHDSMLTQQPPPDVLQLIEGRMHKSDQNMRFCSSSA